MVGAHCGMRCKLFFVCVASGAVSLVRSCRDHLFSNLVSRVVCNDGVCGSHV